VPLIPVAFDFGKRSQFRNPLMPSGNIKKTCPFSLNISKG
jgi:hypothetical protein